VPVLLFGIISLLFAAKVANNFGTAKEKAEKNMN